ncbi:MAG: baseplate J/gp47 family protein [Thermomicrobia bacterium]|nr:baseplate J/gp47 family protein [Thermomicrobia bacterium]
MSDERRERNRGVYGQGAQSSVPVGIPSPQSCFLIRVTPHATLDRVLDQLRDGPPGSVTLLLDPLSVLFATPDHFRALDAVRVSRRLSVTIEVADAHRTGLALAFGYRVRAPGDYPARDTAPVNDIQYGPPNRTGAVPVQVGAVGSRQSAVARSQHPSHQEVARNTHTTRKASAVLRRLRVALLVVGVALCTVVAAGVIVWNVQTADVSVQPMEQSFSQVVPFAVSVAPTNDPNTLQTTPFETTLTREGDAPATGSTNVPDGVASGLMTFRSRADGATTIKAGTALKGPHDLSYLTQSDIVVPGLDFVRGKLGEVTAKVQAAQPGPVGNLAAGFSARFTDNVTYISGDITGGTEKQVAVVTDSDIASVRARLESDLRMRALTEVNALLPAGATALNDYLTLGTPTTSAQPAVGAQAESVHVHITIAARLPVYNTADFDALVDRRLSEAVRAAGTTDGGAREVLPTSVVKSKPTFVDVQGPLVRYFATVTGKTRAIVSDADLARLRGSLVGKDARGAEQLLAGDPKLSGHSIHYGPAWLPKIVRDRMPHRSSQIHLHSSVQP